jgi:hypothetical protein
VETAIFELSIDGSNNPPVQMEVTILDDLSTGSVGFTSPRFSINEGSKRGFAELWLWRTLNTRKAATITYRIEGNASAMAVLGGRNKLTAEFQPGESQIPVRLPLINNTVAQGTQEVTLTVESSSDGMAIMGDGRTVLTLADDDTLPKTPELSITEHHNELGIRGIQLSALVPRGYQVPLEYSDSGAGGPWKPYRTLEGADTERCTFDTLDASIMRMFRALAPEPMDYTFPW